MAKTFGVSIPDGDTIVEDLKKLIGRESLSSAVVKALHDYKKNRSGMRESGQVNLPDWRTWQKFTFDIPEKDLKQYKSMLKQLLTITEDIEEFRSGKIKPKNKF